MNILKQSTAVNLMFGPFLDDTDGKTYETALTLASGNVRLSKAGAGFVGKNTGSLTHNEYGFYSGQFNTTDTNTLGDLTIHISGAGALPVWRQFTVVPAAIYDSWVAGTDYQQVDVLQWSGTAVLAAQSNRPDVYVGAMANNVITSGVLASDAIASATAVIIASGNAAGWNNSITSVNVSGLTSAALSQIVSSGNAASWNVINGATVTITGVATGAITSSAFAASAITSTAIASSAITSAKIDSTYLASVAGAITTSGNTAGWADGATASEVWANGTRSLTDAGVIVTGIFNEDLVGSLDFRTAQIEQWAYSANDVNLSGTSSGVYHSYYDSNDSGLYVLFATPSGRTRTDL